MRSLEEPASNTSPFFAGYSPVNDRWLICRSRPLDHRQILQINELSEMCDMQILGGMLQCEYWPGTGWNLE